RRKGPSRRTVPARPGWPVRLGCCPSPANRSHAERAGTDESGRDDSPSGHRLVEEQRDVNLDLPEARDSPDSMNICSIAGYNSCTSGIGLYGSRGSIDEAQTSAGTLDG